MRYFQIIWDDDDDPDGNVQHIAQHGLTVEDVEHVLENPEDETTLRRSDRPCFFGYTPAGEYIIIIFEIADDDTIYPITAYEVPEL